MLSFCGALCCCPGNDLGRVLRWGAGYSGEDPYSILISVDEADNVLMDRWTILLDAEEPAEGAENGVAEPEPPKVRWGLAEVWISETLVLLRVARNVIVSMVNLQCSLICAWALLSYFLVKRVLCLDLALQFWWDGWSQNTFLYCLAKSIW